jgi:hypothetical protein
VRVKLVRVKLVRVKLVRVKLVRVKYSGVTERETARFKISAGFNPGQKKNGRLTIGRAGSYLEGPQIMLEILVSYEARYLSVEVVEILL